MTRYIFQCEVVQQWNDKEGKVQPINIVAQSKREAMRKILLSDMINVDSWNVSIVIKGVSIV